MNYIEFNPIYIKVEDGKVQSVYGSEQPCPIIVCDYDDAKEGDEFAIEYCEKLNSLVENQEVTEIW